MLTMATIHHAWTGPFPSLSYLSISPTSASWDHLPAKLLDRILVSRFASGGLKPVTQSSPTPALQTALDTPDSGRGPLPAPGSGL